MTELRPRQPKDIALQAVRGTLEAEPGWQCVMAEGSGALALVMKGTPAQVRATFDLLASVLPDWPNFPATRPVEGDEPVTAKRRTRFIEL